LPDAQEFLDRKIKQDSNFAQKLEVNNTTIIFKLLSKSRAYLGIQN
jgi:hypothetical protein